MHIALIASTAIFGGVLVAGVALRVTGPVNFSSHLSVASRDSHWLVFFESPEHEPLFNMMVGFQRADGAAVLASDSRAVARLDANWCLGDDTGFIRERFVDDVGSTHLLITDFRIPGIFYMNYQWPDARVLTFALQWWFLFGLSGLPPALWMAYRLKERLRPLSKSST